MRDIPSGPGPFTFTAEPSIADPAFFSTLEKPARFLLMRHGESEGNARMIIQGRLDMVLNERGRSQAKALAAWLRERAKAGQPIAAFFSSPLARAAETAAILAAEAGLPAPLTSTDLMELDTGVFSGRSMEESRALYPEAFAAYERESWDAVPGAESSGEVFARAMKAWSHLLEAAREGGGDVACVTHGGLIQWLFRCTFGRRSWMPLMPTGNCCVYELCVRPFPGGMPSLLWSRINFTVDAALPATPAVF